MGNNVYSSVFAWPCVPFNMSEPQCRRAWRWCFDHLKACRHSEEVDGEPAVGASSAQAGSGNHQAHAVLGPDAVALLMARYRDAARLAHHVCKEEVKEVGVGTLQAEFPILFFVLFRLPDIAQKFCSALPSARGSTCRRGRR